MPISDLLESIKVTATIDGLPIDEFERRRLSEQADRLRADLVYSVATDDRSALSAHERLQIVTHSGLTTETRDRTLADLFLAAGCRTEAAKIFSKLNHWRKAGDVMLATGDYAAARTLYSRPANGQGSGVLRSGPDHDRLMIVALLQSDWHGFVQAFQDARIEPLGAPPFERQVILGHSAVSGPTWAKRLAIAVAAGGLVHDPTVAAEACRALGLDSEAWRQLLDWAAALSDDQRSAEVQKAIPRMLRSSSLSLEEALQRGDTEISRRIGAWIAASPAGVRAARIDLDHWLETGERSSLDRVVAWLSGACGLFSLTKTAWFTLTAYRQAVSGPPDRVLEVYRAHPHLLRLNLGHYILIKLRERLPLTGEDLLSGIFATLAFPAREFMPQSKDEITVDRLQSCEPWAEVRLEEWIRVDGVSVIGNATERLRTLDPGRTSDIRQHPEWLAVTNAAIAWLSRRWHEQIGTSPWISESQAFELLKRRFRKRKVLRHDQPFWLAPQHLDIHIPEIHLAVEYMGVQHYEAIEAFGGEDALRRTIERDGRKAAACKAVGVALEYIRYDEDLAVRVDELADRYGGTPATRKRTQATRAKN